MCRRSPKERNPQSSPMHVQAMPACKVACDLSERAERLRLMHRERTNCCFLHLRSSPSNATPRNATQRNATHGCTAALHCCTALHGTAARRHGCTVPLVVPPSSSLSKASSKHFRLQECAASLLSRPEALLVVVAVRLSLSSSALSVSLAWCAHLGSQAH